MATMHGNAGVVKVGANTVAEVKSWQYQGTAETADTTSMGDTSKTHTVGQLSWTATVECHFDDTDTTGQGALIEGSTATIALLPEGATTGDYQVTGSGTVTNFSISQDMTNTTSASITLQGNGDITRDTAA